MHSDLKNSQHAVYRAMGRSDLIEQIPEAQSQDAALERWKENQSGSVDVKEAERAYLQGLDLENQRSLKEAKAAYERLLDRFPDFASAACRLGYVLEALRSPHEAVEAYSKAVAADDQFGLAFFRLGLMRKQCGDYDGAIAAYREAISLEPRNGSARNNLGLLLIDKERWEEAEEQFEEILKLFPGAKNATKNLSAARLRIKRSGSGCFIATAAMGSGAASEVMALRRWRDATLMRRATGRMLVAVYYKVSPRIAQWLLRHRYWRVLIRLCVVLPLARLVSRRQRTMHD